MTPTAQCPRQQWSERKCLFVCLFEIWFRNVVQAGIELSVVILYQPPECLDYKCAPSCPANVFFLRTSDIWNFLNQSNLKEKWFSTKRPHVQSGWVSRQLREPSTMLATASNSPSQMLGTFSVPLLSSCKFFESPVSVITCHLDNPSFSGWVNLNPGGMEDKTLWREGKARGVFLCYW